MRVVADRYVLKEQLGQGGVATVYRTLDQSLQVIRAIKLVDLNRGEEQRSRLRAEARAMASLEHPNICRIYDVGVDGEHDYITMEYAANGSVADQIEATGPLPVVRAVEIILQVLSALEHAHAANIIHRDVKPENILLDEAGGVYLCDFGIALVNGTNDRLTKTGTAMGSLSYMPPEQRRDPRIVENTADQYATGATLYYLLCGRNPVDLYLAPKLSDRWEGIPEHIGDVIRIATAARPSDRYRDARSMGGALGRAFSREDFSDKDEPLTDPFFRPSIRAKGHALLMGISAVSLAVGVSAVVVLDLQKSHPKQSVAPPSDPIPSQIVDLTGSWLGSWNMNTGARLQLSGPSDALHGKMWIPLGDDQLLTLVSGRYDPEQEQLILVDVGDTTTPGTYSATVIDGMFLSGTFQNDVGAQASFRLVRVAD